MILSTSSGKWRLFVFALKYGEHKHDMKHVIQHSDADGLGNPLTKKKSVQGIGDCDSKANIEKKESMWVFPKIGGKPQNGWFIEWKTLLKWMIWGAHPYFWVDTHVVLEIWPFSSGSFAIFLSASHFSQDLQLLDQCKPWLAHRFRRQKGLNPSGFPKELSPRWKAVDHHVCKNDFNESFFCMAENPVRIDGYFILAYPTVCCFFGVWYMLDADAFHLPTVWHVWFVSESGGRSKSGEHTIDFWSQDANHGWCVVTKSFRYRNWRYWTL